MKKRFWPSILLVLVFILSGIQTVSAEIIPARGEGQIGLQAVVLCNTLTVRKEPNGSAKAVKTLQYGALPIVTKQEDGWAYCVLGDSENSPSGWINIDYILIDPSWYKTGDKTPVYAWYDTASPKVALLDKGTTLPILKDEGDWLIVSLRGATGWIRKTKSDASSAPDQWSQPERQNGERFETSLRSKAWKKPSDTNTLRTTLLVSKSISTTTCLSGTAPLIMSALYPVLTILQIPRSISK